MLRHDSKLHTPHTSALLWCAIATICVFAFACSGQDAGSSQEQNTQNRDCGIGVALETSSRSLCVYRKEIVIETGFNCPADLMFMEQFGDVVVCRSSDSMTPGEIDILEDFAGDKWGIIFTPEDRVGVTGGLIIGEDNNLKEPTTDPDKDTDADGLLDVQELEIGTDIDDVDTDDDGLTDGEEVSKLGTNPLSADTDGDGLHDAEEQRLGLDPTRASSLDDGVFDGDRFVATTCNQDRTQAILSSQSMEGDWTLFLPESMNLVRNLQSSTSLPSSVALAVYSNTSKNIHGFTTSTAKPSGSLQESLDQIEAFLKTDSVLVEAAHPVKSYSARQNYQTLQASFLIRTIDATHADILRQRYLLNVSNTKAESFTNLPTTGQNTSSKEFRVLISVSRTATHEYVSMALTNLDGAEKDTLYTLRSLTDGTHITPFSGNTRSDCKLHRNGWEHPRVDVYWVLNHSLSMNARLGNLQRLAPTVFQALNQRGLDYRMGVTNMSHPMKGRMRDSAAWHTDISTFQNEIQDYVVDCSKTLKPAECLLDQAHGLYSAREGIRYMLDPTSPQKHQLRQDARLITVFVTNEEDQSIVDLRDPNERPKSPEELERDYRGFFQNSTRVVSIVGGQGCGSFSPSYENMADATQGTQGDVCSSNLAQEVANKLVDAAAGLGGVTLTEYPISSTIEVFHEGSASSAIVVPRDAQNGFSYDASKNTISFHGSFAQEPNTKFSVHYQTFE